MKQKYRVKINRQKRLAEDVYLIRLERPEDFNFRAGQHISAGLPDDVQQRVYSIASGPEEDFIDIIYDLKKDGYLTPIINKKTVGDPLDISHATGSFVDSSGPAYWIATGTGIAPFVSMMRSGLTESKILVHGGKKGENFYFEAEFRAALCDNYIRCASRDHAAGDFNGRVTQWIEQQNDLPEDALYYLCGRAQMVVECRDKLIEKQVPFNRIIAEIYF